MSRAQRQISRETTGDRSCTLSNQVPFTSEFSKMLTKSTPHFGSFSQHSFFSRHNPHPHRVRHIQDLKNTDLPCDGLAICPGCTPALTHRLLDIGTSFPVTHYGISGRK
ncbi:hypothetical protein AMECASPLE_014628 [Ameca splendens]|uniref:Uncharacterized protein n=1 Tax=Ameca splendens TaxID=208324 RepID=A0ABV1A0E2_9TELE